MLTLITFMGCRLSKSSNAETFDSINQMSKYLSTFSTKSTCRISWQAEKESAQHSLFFYEGHRKFPWQHLLLSQTSDFIALLLKFASHASNSFYHHRWQVRKSETSILQLKAYLVDENSTVAATTKFWHLIIYWPLKVVKTSYGDNDLPEKNKVNTFILLWRKYISATG